MLKSLIEPPDRLIPEERRALALIVHNGGKSLLDRQGDAPFSDDARERRGSLVNRLFAGAAMLDRAEFRGRDLDAETAPGPTCFVLLPSPTATTVTLVFSGNHSEFTFPTNLVTDYDTHVILIRDPQRCFCLAGIPGLGATYQECLARLQTVIAALKPERRFCIGVSSGGSASLRYGCDLDVDGILGFSVPTTLNLDDDEGAELRHYPQLTRLYAIDRTLGIDLAAYYRKQSPRPAATLVYSPGHIRDAWLAERMGGIDGVELVATENFVGHGTYRWLKDESRLGPLFDMMYASTRAGSA